MPEVYVVRPQSASAAGLTLAATTQAIQDAIIYARTSGYLSKRHVDIGDRVTPGQLLAEIASPEIDQQPREAQVDLQQSEKHMVLQKANLDLARTTMERYLAADAEGAVAKQAVDQNVSAHRTPSPMRSEICATRSARPGTTCASPTRSSRMVWSIT